MAEHLAANAAEKRNRRQMRREALHQKDEFEVFLEALPEDEDSGEEAVTKTIKKAAKKTQKQQKIDDYAEDEEDEEDSEEESLSRKKKRRLKAPTVAKAELMEQYKSEDLMRSFYYFHPLIHLLRSAPFLCVLV